MEKLHSIEPVHEGRITVQLPKHWHDELVDVFVVRRTANSRAQLAAAFCGLGESIAGAHDMMADLITERAAE